MSVGKIVLVTLLSCFIICDCGNAERIKNGTFTWGFTQRLRDCRLIGHDFDKLEGNWYYLVRIVNPGAPVVRCGNLTVHATSKSGFSSELTYLGTEDETIQVPLVGKFVSNYAVEIGELSNLIWGVSDWSEYPFNVEIVICGDVFFIEPIHYFGGTMVFRREIPTDMKTFANYFWIPLEIGNTARRKGVRRKCTKV